MEIEQPQNKKIMGLDKWISLQSSDLSQLNGLTLLIKQNISNEEICQKISFQIPLMDRLLQLSIHSEWKDIKQLGAQHIANGLSHLIQLKKLNIHLKNCDIGEQGYQYLVNEISKLTNLTSWAMEVLGDPIKNSGLNSLSLCLSQLVNLTDLSLRMNIHKTEAIGFELFSNSLSKLLELTELSLNFKCNLIEPHEIHSICYGFKDLVKLKKLSVLLWPKMIECIDELEFMPMFQRLVNLQDLNINFYELKQINKAIIAAESTSSSQTSAVSPSIQSGFRHLINLQNLILDFTPLSQNGSQLKCIAEQLPHLSLLSSLSLSFDSTHLLMKDVNDLANMFQQLQALSSFTLKLDQIRFSGQCQELLFKGISMIPNLELFSLYLSDTPLSESRIQQISSQFSQLVRLKTLDLSIIRSVKSNLGLECFLQSVQNFTALQNLHIIPQGLIQRDDDMLYLTTSLSKLENLRFLTLNFAYVVIGAQGAAQISNCIATLKNLSSIVICLNTKLIQNIDGQPQVDISNQLFKGISQLKQLNNLTYINKKQITNASKQLLYRKNVRLLKMFQC